MDPRGRKENEGTGGQLATGRKGRKEWGRKGRKENEGTGGQLVMDRKDRKGKMALRETEVLQVLRKEAQCTLAGVGQCAPVCLVQRRCIMAILQEQGQ